MIDEQVDRLVKAVNEHGDQLGGNLVHLKRFLDAQRKAQQKFLAEQRDASDKAQMRASRAAMFSAVAAVIAACAAIAQAYAATFMQ
jgi:hypothetical protein